MKPALTGTAGRSGKNDAREVLGCGVGDSEDGAFWLAFLRSLRARGLTGVQLVISDAHEGVPSKVVAEVLGPRVSAHHRGHLHARHARYAGGRDRARRGAARALVASPLT